MSLTSKAGVAILLCALPHPFVVGEAGYQAFLDVMSLCTAANIARRAP